MTTKAYGYLRVSGKSQVDGDGFPRQRAAIAEYAVANGMEVVGWYEERAVPGAMEWDERPAWAAMVEALNGVRTILIERLDRLARDLLVQEHIVADLRKRDVVLVSTLEPDLGSTEPTRVLIRQMIGAVAQYDKSMTVLKLRGSRQRKKAASGRCEGQKPYGHYPNEVGVLAEMKRLEECGLTLDRIAKDLTEAGMMARSGKPWHPHVVGRILRAQ